MSQGTLALEEIACNISVIVAKFAFLNVFV